MALFWMAAITGPWTFKSHKNKEIYDLVQCAIKVHVLMPSTFTARSGCAALLLQVYHFLVEKQLLVFLGGRLEKAERWETVDEGSRVAKCEQVPKCRSLIIVITPDYCREFSRFSTHRRDKKVLKLIIDTVDHQVNAETVYFDDGSHRSLTYSPDKSREKLAVWK